MFIKNSLEPRLNDQDFIHAITGGEAFRVVLQPQHDLLTGALVGAEALARWDHPQHGEIAPSLFIPALTRLGGEPGLFKQVVRQIQAVLWVLVEADAACPISVNTSVATLSIPGLLRELERSLNESRVSPRLMKIEITEDLAIDDLQSLADELHRMRAQGFGISMDDFGIGTSTLERLTQLPFTELKIDRSFVRRMLHQPAAGAVVRAALELGNTLGMEVVAEGVECAEQIHLLRESAGGWGKVMDWAPPWKSRPSLPMRWLRRASKRSLRGRVCLAGRRRCRGDTGFVGEAKQVGIALYAQLAHGAGFLRADGLF